MSLFIAVDTDFILALALGAPSAEWCVDFFTGRGACLMATPAVIQQLQDIKENGDQFLRPPADVAVRMLATWGFVQPGFNDIEHQITSISARKLLEAQHCDDFQSALVYCEAAKLACWGILTYRAEIAEKDDRDLRMFMKFECHLSDTMAISPLMIIGYLTANDEEAAPSELPSIQRSPGELIFDTGVDGMDRAREFDIVVNKARRGGFLKAHYPADGLAVIERGPIAEKPVDIVLLPPPADSRPSTSGETKP